MRQDGRRWAKSWSHRMALGALAEAPATFDYVVVVIVVGGGELAIIV